MFHIPVLKREVTDILARNPEGLYVDCTLGAGGHTLGILGPKNAKTKVIGIERDSAAIAVAEGRLKGYESRTQIIKGNFRNVDTLLEGRLCDGFLLDLGLSSLQLEDLSRGFSYLKDGPLDMAMGENGRSVQELISKADRNEIIRILREFGEVRKSRMIAESIIRQREEEGVTTAFQLRGSVERVFGKRVSYPVLSRVFQAFRIWANDEMENLREFLPKSVELTRTGARIAVISYHSLEDRVVKRFFAEEQKGCICPDDFPVCVCDRIPRLKILTRKPITPSAEEIEENPRSRSAKLRVAERIEDEEKT